MKVLVVDDDPFSLGLLEAILKNWNHQVVCAGGGAEAWALMESDPELSLVITDWLMPDVDGLELCRRARTLDRERYLPMVVLTGRHEDEDLVVAMEAGADAFLTKPFSPHELFAHLRVVKRVKALEYRLAKKVGELNKAKQIMEDDLKAAGDIQRSLLPNKQPEMTGVETDWMFSACSATAGDMLNLIQLDEHRLGMYVLDVSGHGCQAALLSVSLSRVLTPFPQQGGLLKELKDGGYQIPSPADVAAALNRQFPVMQQSGQYVTFLYGILDLCDGSFEFVSAGHPAMLHFSGGKATEGERRSNIPIGWVPEYTYNQERICLSEGDMVLFYSDGFEEAVNPQGEELGRAQLVQVLEERPHWPVGEAIKAITARVETHSADVPQRDDMTMVGFRFTEKQTK